MGGMNKVHNIFAVLLLLGSAVPAQQVNIFGKVADAKGAALDSVAVRLARHPAIADTTGKNGQFSLSARISAVIAGILSGTIPFAQCAGASVHFAVDRPTRVVIEVFNTTGRRLTKPLDGI
jgi:hypothetical protein